MATLSLKISIVERTIVKTMQFDPSTIVFDACKIIRDRIQDPDLGNRECIIYFFKPFFFGGGGLVLQIYVVLYTYQHIYIYIYTYHYRMRDLWELFIYLSDLVFLLSFKSLNKLVGFTNLNQGIVKVHFCQPYASVCLFKTLNFLCAVSQD